MRADDCLYRAGASGSAERHHVNHTTPKRMAHGFRFRMIRMRKVAMKQVAADLELKGSSENPEQLLTSILVELDIPISLHLLLREGY